MRTLLKGAPRTNWDLAVSICSLCPLPLAVCSTLRLASGAGAILRRKALRENHSAAAWPACVLASRSSPHARALLSSLAPAPSARPVADLFLTSPCPRSAP